MSVPRRSPERNALLAAVEQVRPVVLAHADDAEQRRTLSPAVVDALHAAGLFAMVTPRALGGAEADPLTQLEVFEAMTHADTSAGWSLMIGAISTGFSAYLPERGAARVFAGHRPLFAGLLQPQGVAQRARDGYVVSGRWSFGSGIRHASWVNTVVAIAPEPGAPPSDAPPFLHVVVPVEQVVIEDTWDAAGLRGSGSHHYRMEGVLVSDDLCFPWPAAAARRGGPLYRLPFVAFTTAGHVGFALGAARRALDEIAAIAPKRVKAWPQTPLGAHPAFQMDLGRAEAKLAAARALAFDVVGAMWDRALAGAPLSIDDWASVRVVTPHVTEVAAEAASFAFRSGGGGALFAASPLQRYFRDIQAAAQHIAATDDAYEFAGRVRLGVADLHPLLAPRPAA